MSSQLSASAFRNVLWKALLIQVLSDGVTSQTDLGTHFLPKQDEIQKVSVKILL